MPVRRLYLFLSLAGLILLLTLSGCGNDKSVADTSNKNTDPKAEDTTDTYVIKPGPDASFEAVAAFIDAGPGDTIRFTCGFFEINTGLVLQNTEGVTIEGCGMDKTVLSFADSSTPVGIFASNVKGIVIQDLTVIDTPGDGIKTKSADIVTMRNVRAMWSSADQQVTASNYKSAMDFKCPVSPSRPYTYASDSDNGRYGIYPVESTDVLLDNVEAIGASDAAIYVGQSDDVIVRNSHAMYSVAGFELENIQRGDMYDNVSECNTFGYLVYDLAYLNQYGNQVRMYDNVARNNNFPNFAAGGMVANVPRGIGLVTLAFDNLEVFGNTFKHNSTAGIVITSYKMIGDPGDEQLDMYDEGLNIHNNVFKHNGFNPLFDLEKAIKFKLRALLSSIIAVKNGGEGAHILWDGLYDEPHLDCPYPTTESGEPVPSTDQGKPIYQTSLGANPNCRYNLYKFEKVRNSQGETVYRRKKPEMYICIENNTFSGDSINYANFHGRKGAVQLIAPYVDGKGALPTLPELIKKAEEMSSKYPGLIASNDISPHHCSSEYGETLDPLPKVTLDTYTLPEGGGSEPTDAQVKALCTQNTGGKINYEALANVNCPRLAQYHLFEDPDDPTRNAKGRSIPYDLNTKLFSDYAVKHRIVFLPRGTTAKWPDDPHKNLNATLKFPVGTVISKTFSFPNEPADTVNHVETRLLIKRQDKDGTVHWKGLAYIWETKDNGETYARLALGGGEASVSWHYTDDDGDLHIGSTDSYSIPNATQCISCHSNNDRPAGSPPIGPKPRNMNKPYGYEGAGKLNQLAHWIKAGFLSGAPKLNVNPNTQLAQAIARVPDFDDPGNSGEPVGSYADLRDRARAWLAVNCSYCHNPGGMASNTGLFLHWFGPVGSSFGVCKNTTAAGAGSGGRTYDIYPGDASKSIIPYRIGSNKAVAQMPPIARSVVHKEAMKVVKKWINKMTAANVKNASCVPR